MDGHLRSTLLGRLSLVMCTFVDRCHKTVSGSESCGVAYVEGFEGPKDALKIIRDGPQKLHFEPACLLNE